MVIVLEALCDAERQSADIERFLGCFLDDWGVIN
jgi:hypothetical protein